MWVAMIRRTFDGSVPPARRVTDRLIMVGFCGVALLAWAVVVRLAVRGDGFALVYAVPSLAISWAAVQLAWIVWRHRRLARVARASAHQAGSGREDGSPSRSRRSDLPPVADASHHPADPLTARIRRLPSLPTTEVHLDGTLRFLCPSCPGCHDLLKLH